MIFSSSTNTRHKLNLLSLFSGGIKGLFTSVTLLSLFIPSSSDYQTASASGLQRQHLSPISKSLTRVKESKVNRPLMKAEKNNCISNLLN